jgi:hypothetical protein
MPQLKRSGRIECAALRQHSANNLQCKYSICGYPILSSVEPIDYHNIYANVGHTNLVLFTFLQSVV